MDVRNRGIVALLLVGAGFVLLQHAPAAAGPGIPSDVTYRHEVIDVDHWSSRDIVPLQSEVGFDVDRPPNDPNPEAAISGNPPPRFWRSAWIVRFFHALRPIL